MSNENNNQIDDFINMYNAIIKHCSNKQRHYDIKLYFIDGKLYFQVIDKESQTILHNCDLECSEKECTLIYTIITDEFITNHQLKYTAYIPMSSSDIVLYHKLSKRNNEIAYYENCYYNNKQPMMIHALENSIFTLNVYQYNGIDEQTEILHQNAIDKINLRNIQYLLKK